MPKATHSLHLRQPFKRRLVPLYITSFFLIFHGALVAYINSSYLEQYISTTSVGTLYTIGASISIFVFLFISRVLRRVGNFHLTVGLFIVEFLAVLGMAHANSLEMAIPLFLVHLITIPLIFFNIDVFIEEIIGNKETVTGSSRGLLLASASLIGAISPLTSSFLVDEVTGSFSLVYTVSALSLIPAFILLIFYYKNFSDPAYNEIKLFDAIRFFWQNLNIRLVFLAHFVLQLFFMVMVIYTPLYLTQYIGFTWKEFGIIMFFAQLAYIILEYPIGYIADKYIGEKEMMAFGFLVMALATSWMSFVTVPDLVLWSFVMFMTRVGASFVEATTESYFFKKTNSTDAQIISFFRIIRPFSYVFGALLASFALLYLPFNLLFIVTALLMIPAMFFTLNIEDTK